MNKDNSSLPDGGQFLLYEAEDGHIKIDVRLADETVWLTQPLMAELFQNTQQNISQHILNIFDEGELPPKATHKKFLSVRQEGGRQVQRKLDFYNLDMIISVGYRVKSHVAKLDAFLNINDRDILTHAGKISHDIARQLAESEYEKFNHRRITEQDRIGNDFDRLVKQLPEDKKGN